MVNLSGLSSGLRTTISKMIRKYGQDVQHKKKIVVDLGNGQEEIDYVIQDTKRGQFTEVTPLDNMFEHYGITVEADYIGTFLPDVVFAEGDLLYIDDQWLEVMTVFKHRTAGAINYIEVLLRRRK